MSKYEDGIDAESYEVFVWRGLYACERKKIFHDGATGIDNARKLKERLQRKYAHSAFRVEMYHNPSPGTRILAF